jgi:hypothetical protein
VVEETLVEVEPVPFELVVGAFAHDAPTRTRRANAATVLRIPAFFPRSPQLPSGVAQGIGPEVPAEPDLLEAGIAVSMYDVGSNLRALPSDPQKGQPWDLWPCCNLKPSGRLRTYETEKPVLWDDTLGGLNNAAPWQVSSSHPAVPSDTFVLVAAGAT